MRGARGADNDQAFFQAGGQNCTELKGVLRQPFLSVRSRSRSGWLPSPIDEPVPTRLPRGEGQKTYNTRDSLVVTDSTTDLALMRLTRGERTGSRTFAWIWSYVSAVSRSFLDIG